MKTYWINEKILECKCTSSVPLIFFFFFTLSRNFSLEEGKSMEKMEEINPPSDVRRIGVGQSTGRARFDGLTTNLRAATIGRYQELLPC